jgi:hypothetical protein
MADAAPSAREDSVAALLAVAQRVAEDERARGVALTAKASTLAGFSGTILSLVAALGRAQFDRSVGSVADVILGALFLLSVLALAAAGTFAIRGVLSPRPRFAISARQLRAFAGPPWTSADPVEIDGNMLASLATAVGRDREENDRRATLADRAALALLIGLLAVAGQAVSLGVTELLD